MEDFLSAQAEEDFEKARHSALFNEIAHFLTQDNTELISFREIKQLLKPQGEVYVGMKVVPVKLIVGSEGRYQDFDNRFFPRAAHLKNRWENVDKAHLQDIILPSVSLYELGGVYFVRDGNHRVSVAKSKGIEFIDAEVVSLQSEIKLHPGDSLKKMKKQVIEYEKRVFYGETGFGDVTDYWCLDFSIPGQYDVIYNHILTHKYYINQNKSEEIGMDEAMLSWINSVYFPIIRVIDRHKIMRVFKGRTKSDLYVWLIKYWDDIKKQFGSDFPIDEMANRFLDAHKKPSFIRRIKNRLSGILMRKRLANSGI